MRTIGKALKEIREAAGLTERELASASGIYLARIKQIEKCRATKNLPKTEKIVLKSIMDILHITKETVLMYMVETKDAKANKKVFKDINPLVKDLIKSLLQKRGRAIKRKLLKTKNKK